VPVPLTSLTSSSSSLSIHCCRNGPANADRNVRGHPLNLKGGKKRKLCQGGERQKESGGHPLTDPTGEREEREMV
jgi:hypothetical protein